MNTGKWNLRRPLSLLLAVLLVVSGSLVLVSAEPTASGTQGENLTWTLENGTLTISGEGNMQGGHGWKDYKDQITTVVIEKGVTGIGYEAFSGCTELTNITIPESVTYIDNYAFSGCTGLASITIPNGVTEIGGGAFRNTAYYSNESNWENDVLYIGKNLIEAKKSISRAYSIKEGTSLIADGAFSDCVELTGITIHDGVTGIDRDVFRGCTGLTSVTIPDGVAYIGEYAFADCTGLTNIVIPDSVTRIDGAFMRCTGLTSINIPDSVTKIGSSAFYGCTGLASITISDDVTEIGGHAFENTAYYNNQSNWENDVLYLNHYLLNANESISGTYNIKEGTSLIAGSAFQNRIGLTSITIPDSVTGIGSSAFQDCTGLTSITIPDSITNIGEYMFIWCDRLTSITIPESVTSISDWAFDGCEDLTIYGKKGSYAETFAKEKNIPFKEIGSDKPAVPGEIDGDGVLEATDCLKARRAFFGLIPTTDKILRAVDFNNNGRIDPTDCMRQRRMFFGLIA